MSSVQPAVAVDGDGPTPPQVYGAVGGRRRRIDPQVVVHLVLADGAEVTLGAESQVVRSMAHLAALLVER